MKNLFLSNIESNTIVGILNDVYLRLNDSMPPYDLIYDGILELCFDNAISIVTYRGVRMHYRMALDMLEDILEFQEYDFEKDGVYHRPGQLKIYDEEDFT